MESVELESTTLTQRIVLLGALERAVSGDTPANSAEVNAACADHLGVVEGDVVGDLSKREVIRALNELEAAGYLDQSHVEDASAVGKGRPCYTLAVDAEQTLDALADDERVANLVERVVEA